MSQIQKKIVDAPKCPDVYSKGVRLVLNELWCEVDGSPHSLGRHISLILQNFGETQISKLQTHVFLNENVL